MPSTSPAFMRDCLDRLQVSVAHSMYSALIVLAARDALGHEVLHAATAREASCADAAHDGALCGEDNLAWAAVYVGRAWV